jgi:hypothetical protein
MKVATWLLSVAILISCVCRHAAAGVTVTLGEQAFNNGDLMWITAYLPPQAGEPAPFDTLYGFDSAGGPSFSQSWTFNYAAITDPLASASITVGVYNHDSARPGDQVASFGVDGNDLTSDLNTLFNSYGGTDVFPPFPPTMEYNIYTLALPGSTFASLADGSATFSLTMQNGFGYPGFTPTDFVHNGMGLDFSTLDITTDAAIPEPSTFFTLSLAGIAMAGLGWCRRRKTSAVAVGEQLESADPN